MYLGQLPYTCIRVCACKGEEKKSEDHKSVKHRQIRQIFSMSYCSMSELLIVFLTCPLVRSKFADQRLGTHQFQFKSREIRVGWWFAQHSNNRMHISNVPQYGYGPSLDGKIHSTSEENRLVEDLARSLNTNSTPLSKTTCRPPGQVHPFDELKRCERGSRAAIAEDLFGWW